MYEERFGFKSNPFRTALKGSAIFVGPQQAKVISTLQKGLSGTDNVVTVSGAAGVGKTTIVNRALETNKAHQMVASIGRMRLAPDEVMELLLAGFGVSRQPTSMVQKFAAFQRILNDRAQKNIRVVIVIEDALRIGNDALLELEAITAADTGFAGGANLILMGPPEIDKRLQFPEFGRLKQRSRLGQKIIPFNVMETRGYLKHCVRAAEGEFDKVFDEDAADMIFRCSEGVPRVINSLCDSALTAAFERKVERVDAGLVQTVALDVYGLVPLPPIAPVPDVKTATEEHARLEYETGFESAEAVDCDVEITASALLVDGLDRSVIRAPVATLAPSSVRTSAAARSQFDPDATLPPIVADLIARGSQKIADDKTPDVIEQSTKGDDSDSDSDCEASLELPDLSDLDEQYDVADDALIADTGMNVPPQFRADPDLDIQPSQLARKQVEAFSPAPVVDDEELPTLSPESHAATVPAVDDSDLPVLDTVVDDEEIEPVDDFPVDSVSAARDIEATATDLPALNRMKDADVPVLQGVDEEPVPADSPDAVEVSANIALSTNNDDGVEDEMPVPDLDALEAAISAARRADPLADPLPKNAAIFLDVALADKAKMQVDTPQQSVDVDATHDQREFELPDFSALEFEEPVVDEPAFNHAESNTDDSVEASSDSVIVPAITLDRILEDQRKEGSKLDQMASELARASSLEDISDIMAETLFGEDFTNFAAEALASHAVHNEAVFGHDVLASPSSSDDERLESPANDSINEESSLVLSLDEAILDMPAYEVANVVLAEEPEPRPAVKVSSVQPDSIDDQFQTSITQTLKALSVRNATGVAEPDDTAQKSGGFFGKLKRSFKGQS